MKKYISVLMLLTVCICLLTACTYNIVPSQYDLKLKSHVEELFFERGGTIEQTELTIDSRCYQELDSAQRTFLSYHILDVNNNVLVNDGIRTPLVPIPARGVGKETVNLFVPIEEGKYILEIDLVEEDVTWFSAQGMKTLQIPMTVKDSVNADYTQISLISANADVHVPSGNGFEILLTVTNNSGVTLCNSGAQNILVSYHVKDLSGNILSEGERISLPQNISSGEAVTVNVAPQAEIFKIPGNYELEIGLLIEGTAWLQEWGVKPVAISVTVE